MNIKFVGLAGLSNCQKVFEKFSGQILGSRISCALSFGLPSYEHRIFVSKREITFYLILRLLLNRVIKLNSFVGFLFSG